MRLRLIAAAALATAALFATAAGAETLRLPQTGDPAFVVNAPDGWEHIVDAEGNLAVFNVEHTASLTFTVMEYDGALDSLAAGAVSNPDGERPRNNGPVDVSGFHGFVYDGKMISAAGVHANVHLLLVKLDDKHVAGATLLTADGIKDDQAAAARAILGGVTLTALPLPPAPPAEPAPAPAEPAPAPAEPAPAPAAEPAPAPPTPVAAPAPETAPVPASPPGAEPAPAPEPTPKP
jgi:hypothetical protein